MLEPAKAVPARANWSFILQWIIVSTVLVLTLGIVAALLTEPQSLPFNALARNAIASLVLGLVAGALQWTVLRSYLPKAGLWGLATIGGFGVGYIVSRLALRLVFAQVLATHTGSTFADMPRPWEIIPVAFTLVALFILPIGILQWLTLRQHYASSARYWPIALIFAGFALLGIIIVMSLDTPSGTVPTGLFLGVVLASGTVIGIITGLPLLFMFRRPVVVAEPRSALRLGRRGAGVLTASLLGIILADSLIVWLAVQPAIVLIENFDESKPPAIYLTCKGASIEQGRLRFSDAEPYTGCDVPLPSSNFEDFTFITDVYPAGLPTDGSVNVSFRDSDAGGYEIQLRPAQNEIHVMKVVNSDADNPRHDITAGWVKTPEFTFDETGSELKVVARSSSFTLWINATKVFGFVDSERDTFRGGQIRLGVGAAELTPATYAFDGIRVWDP